MPAGQDEQTPLLLYAPSAHGGDCARVDGATTRRRSRSDVESILVASWRKKEGRGEGVRGKRRKNEEEKEGVKSVSLYVGKKERA